MEPWIETHSGAQLRFTQSPREIADVLRIEDVAQGLSNMCRYAGQCNRFYSVAEHSALMAHEVALDTQDRLLALACLLHDASEAFLPDIPSPMKQFLPDYLRLEAQIMVGVAIKWKLGQYIMGKDRTAVHARDPFMYDGLWMDPRVKDLDARIIVNERAALMPKTGHSWFTDGLEPLHRISIECLEPDRARRLFLRTFEVLTTG